MAHWKSGFPSHYLQVSDLDSPLIATIADVKAETVGSGENQERKLVVHFEEPDVKAVVLNLTRAEAIESIVGDPDTARWPGHRVRLFKGVTRYQGKRVACISLAAPDDLDETLQPLKAQAF
jgi:hypothetical protein